MYDMMNLTRLKKLDATVPDALKPFWAFGSITHATHLFAE